MRDKPEKLIFLSKTNYPFWLVQTGSRCVLIDGLNSPAQTFQLDDPIQISVFVEGLKKNSLDPKKFVDALEAQAKTVKDFSTVVNLSYPSLVAETGLLSYFQESLKTAAKVETANDVIIPVDNDAKAAAQIAQTLMNGLRTFKANALGLRIAIDVLKEEAEFHKKGSYSEIEQLREKCEIETSALKPTIDRNMKRLSQKADKILATMQRSVDKKAAMLEKRRESFLHRLQAAEQRKEAVQRRIENAKKKRSKASSGSFALKKYERDIDNLKKEVKILTEDAENLRKTSAIGLRERQEEFDKAFAQEEARLTQIQDAFQAKILVQQERISRIEVQAATITAALENQMSELEQRVAAIKVKVEIDWKIDSEEPLQFRVPIYITKYARGEAEERYVFVTPIAFSKDASMLSGLKKMLSINPEPKLMALMHPANKTLQETLSNGLQQRLLGDSDFRIRLNALGRAANLTNQGSFAQTLNEGLDDLEKRGYITAEEASDLCKRVMGEIAWP